MADNPIPSREELVAALRASGDELVSVVKALPPGQLEEGRYEGGWNGRQILAHVAAIEWTYPRLLEIPGQAAASPGAGDPPTRPAQGGIDAYNSRQVEKREGRSAAELLLEFRTNRAATIEAVQAADPVLFLAPIRSAGGVTGPLGQVVMSVAVGHVRSHARDIAGGAPPSS